MAEFRSTTVHPGGRFGFGGLYGTRIQDRTYSARDIFKGVKKTKNHIKHVGMNTDCILVIFYNFLKCP